MNKWERGWKFNPHHQKYFHLREWDRIMLLINERERQRGNFHALKAGWDENEYSANRNDKINEIKHSKVSKTLGQRNLASRI